MKDAMNDLSARIARTDTQVEESRNKILNVESKTEGAVEKIMEDIQKKVWQVDNFDEKAKQAITGTVSEHRVGQNIRED